MLATKLLHHTKRRLDTIDAVLHRAAADASRTHDRSAHFDGQAATVGSHPCCLSRSVLKNRAITVAAAAPSTSGCEIKLYDWGRKVVLPGL